MSSVSLDPLSLGLVIPQLPPSADISQHETTITGRPGDILAMEGKEIIPHDIGEIRIMNKTYYQMLFSVQQHRPVGTSHLTPNTRECS